jgi:hypothetical protein
MLLPLPLLLLLLLLQVALQPGTGKVLGCIDIRLPQTATGMCALGAAERQGLKAYHCHH